MLDHLTLSTTEGQVIGFDIKRIRNGRRITAKLSCRSSNIQVTAPVVALSIIKDYLQRNIDRFATAVDGKSKGIPFVDGGTILYKGQEVTLRQNNRVKGARFIEGFIEASGTGEEFAKNVENFLKAEAFKVGKAHVNRHARNLGVTYSKFVVKDSIRKWGHCKSTGEIMLNWRLICGAPELIDYVAAHEVSHRIEMNHSAAFWYQVSRTYPEYKAAEAMLKSGVGVILNKLGFE